jgi:hypothetical protein
LERKVQDMSKCGNLLSSWSKFKSEIRKQFYPLGYLHKAMMEWKNLGRVKVRMYKVSQNNLGRDL